MAEPELIGAVRLWGMLLDKIEGNSNESSR